MCLILFAYHYHPRYPLIVAANRDEYYRRPTQSCHWWQERSNLLAGKDLMAEGTWMGITRQGRFAAITNVRDTRQRSSPKYSRGKLPLSYLTESIGPQQFYSQLITSATDYQGYNLLFGSADELCYFSNRSAHLSPIEPGLHGLSNASLNTPWPKITTGLAKLQQILTTEEPDVNAIFRLLETRIIANDSELPDTGVGIERERLLAPVFIESADYGTRSSQILLIDKNKNVRLYEKERAPIKGPVKSFNFHIS